MFSGLVVSDEVSVRQLRNHTADVLRRVESGEKLRVTVDRRPVAELVPLAARATWVPAAVCSKPWFKRIRTCAASSTRRSRTRSTSFEGVVDASALIADGQGR